MYEISRRGPGRRRKVEPPPSPDGAQGDGDDADPELVAALHRFVESTDLGFPVTIDLTREPVTPQVLEYVPH